MAFVAHQIPSSRCVRSFAWSPLWGNGENADGRDRHYDKHMFERPIHRAMPRKRNVYRMAPPGENSLVPEQWKELQSKLNRSKSERKRENYELFVKRSQEEKAKLREKIDRVPADDKEAEKIDRVSEDEVSDDEEDEDERGDSEED